MTFRLDRVGRQRIINPDGTASQQFDRLIEKAWGKIEEAITDLSTQLAAIQAAQATADAAQGTATAAQEDATAAARELARINSYTAPTNVLSGDDEAVGASITVETHTRVYPVQGAIDVPDVVIAAPVTLTLEADGVTGIANAVQYSVYYDDTTLADTTPAYKAVRTATSHADAQAGAAAGRHFVGVITTPADGGGGTGGTGSFPPGGGGGGAIP